MSLPQTALVTAPRDRDARVDREQWWSNAFLFAGPVAAFVAAVLTVR